MQVITTHLNVDFDCLACMMAAKKLYPEAHLVLPWSAEGLVEEFLIEQSPLIEFTQIKDIPLGLVTLLVVVNTHEPEGIGVFAPLMDNPSVEVHLYDHHPEPAIKIDHAVIKNRGASTTILHEILLAKNVALTPEECTLMVLGIYQGTHSLITVSTTPEDLIAAADLIKRGADLNRVASFMLQRLNSEQLDIFNELVSSLESQTGKGVEATLVKVSATINELALVKKKLLGKLERLVQPLIRIKDVMHAPVISADVNDTIESIEKKLTLYNLNTLPVLLDEKLVGLITRKIVEKAIHHAMAKNNAEDLMISRFAVTSPDDYFKSVIPLVIEEKQKLIPVVDTDNNLIGVLSRGDLFRVLHDGLEQDKRPASFQGRLGTQKCLKSLIKERLDKDVFKHLERIAQIGDRLNVSLYVVGGFVRDLLLNIPNQDIDIVVEGEGIPFAAFLAEEFGGRVTSHEKFGTSVVIFPNGYRIDIATARMEYYKYPGALPTVEKSSVKSDLFRRDFTVNSMAVKLTGSNAYCLTDFFNGERDLRSGEIHVLHSLSFIEDPCRLFRAIRFEQRLGFAMGKQAEAFMRSTIKKRLVDSLSGTRLFNEIKTLLNEKNTMGCIRRMQELDLFQFVSPEMLQAPKDLEVLERLDSVFSWADRVITADKPDVWYVYFLGLFYSLKEDAFLKAADRLLLPTRMKNSLQADRIHCRESLELLISNKEWGPKEIYHAFANLSVEAGIYLIALSSTDRLNQYANSYFTQYHGKAEPALTGDDLVKMGLEPGPVFQSVLNVLREARVMGSVSSREEEVALVEEQFLKS
jgi:tRNA nucleotidyltransferase (CCA-adding enzyme)